MAYILLLLAAAIMVHPGWLLLTAAFKFHMPHAPCTRCWGKA